MLCDASEFRQEASGSLTRYIRYYTTNTFDCAQVTHAQIVIYNAKQGCGRRLSCYPNTRLGEGKIKKQSHCLLWDKVKVRYGKVVTGL